MMPNPNPIPPGEEEVRENNVMDFTSVWAEKGFFEDSLTWLFENAKKAVAAHDLDQAIRIFEKMLCLARGNRGISLFVHLQLVAIFQEQNHYAGLKKHFLKAIALDPDNAQLRFRLGRALVSIGRIREAVASFRAAIERAPHHAGYRQELAICLHQLHRTKEAEEEFRNALHKFPDHVGMMNKFVHFLLDENRIEEARGILEKALSLSPQNPELQATAQLIQFVKEKDPPVVDHGLPPLGEVELYEDEDRQEDYQDYLRKNPRVSLTFLDWVALDNEYLKYLYWSSLRDLSLREQERLAFLEKTLAVVQSV